MNRIINIGIICLVFAGFGFLGGRMWSEEVQADHTRNRALQPEFDLFWEVWEVAEEDYAFEVPTERERIFGAISGMVQSFGDDYTDFFDPEDTKTFYESVEGEFSGIGAEIGTEDGFAVVVAPLKNSPAEIAGLRAKDIIVRVDGEDITGLSIDQLITEIRGPVGTDVNVSVIRQSEEQILDIVITRDIIQVPILETDEIDGVFVIYLYNFNKNVSDEFKQALRDFDKSKSEKLLIDVRNNPGGFLDESVDVISYFVPQGKIVLKEKTPDGTGILRSKGFDLLENKAYEIIVLQNEGSASASEILAGALRDHGLAQIVGSQSFGKGSVQELIPLPEDTSLKVTIAKWLTPNDIQISGDGLAPDVEIMFDNELESQGIDSVLFQAVSLFNNVNE